MDSDGLSLLPARLKQADGICDLPVVAVMSQLDKALEIEKRALVQAPPGAGKTTLVPLVLKDRPWLKNKKIIMLEPRRLAARACAAHMASLLGEKSGQTVGYQVRMDRCIGPDTRIEIITEGILTRRLQSDPELDGVGLVIFDEFHERHIHGDLGLALCLESAEVFNPDLRLLVMSATMDQNALSELMDDAPVVVSKGKTWPVDTIYVNPDVKAGTQWGAGPGNKGHQILPACFNTAVKALSEHQGDILVFLPGASQIRALAGKLNELVENEPSVRIHPLFGNLSLTEQRQAIAPSKSGSRKIVLATPIAETSLTIQGIRVVVDSGLANVPRFSPGKGMTRLETIPVSRASADQRRGRAGRTAPGVCYRLWSGHIHQGLVPFNRPEILNADLTALVLELAQWGVNDPGDLKWLDLPPKAALTSARSLLRQLDALDENGRITPHGKEMLTAGIHPRLAHMIIRGRDLGQGFLACCLAGITEERDIVFSDHTQADPDIGLRLEILGQLSRKKTPGFKSFHKNRARAVLDRARNLASRFKIKEKSMDTGYAGRLLAFAWPDRVAKQRKPGSLSYLMASGSGAFFKGENSLSRSEFLVAIHVDGHPKNARIFMAAGYDKFDLEKDFSNDLVIRDQVSWDESSGKVRATSCTFYGKIAVQELALTDPAPVLVQEALLNGICQSGLNLLPWTKKIIGFRHRTLFLKRLAEENQMFKDLPELSDDGLIKNLSDWLGPFLSGVKTASVLKQVDLDGALKSLFTWEQLQMIDRDAPTHFKVPSGSRIPIRYGDENGPFDSPVLAVRLQEMFGMTSTPAIAKGQVPLTLHLLSPASRPVQITQDLENFWARTYKEVKKDLMGRYPKHYWPDDPGSATATNRAKPRTRS